MLNYKKYLFFAAAAVVSAAMLPAPLAAAGTEAASAVKNAAARPAKSEPAAAQQFAEARKLFDQKKYAEFVTASDTVLANPGLSGYDALYALTLRTMSLERQNKFEEAAESQLRKLLEPSLDVKQVFPTRNHAVNLLLRVKKDEQAITLCRASINDSRVADKDKCSAWARMFSICTNNLRDYARAIALYDEALASPVFTADPRRKELALTNKINILVNNLNRRNDGIAMADAAVKDVSFDNISRLRLFNRWAALTLSKRNVDRKPVIARGLELLKLRDGVTPGVYAQTAFQLAKYYRDVQPIDVAALRNLMKSVLDFPEMGNDGKISAAWNIAEQDALANNFAAAEKIMRDCLAYPNLNEKQTIAIATHLGRLAWWQENLDQTITVYRDVLKKFDTPSARKQVNQLISQAYVLFMRHEDAAKVWRDAGSPIREAEIWASVDPAKARALAKSVLVDEKADPADRREAYSKYFIPRADPESKAIRAKYAEFYTDKFNPAPNKYSAFFWQVRSSLLQGNYDMALEMAEYARHSSQFPDNADMILCHAHSLFGVGRNADAVAMLVQYGQNPKFSSERRLLFALTAEIGKKDFAGMDRAFAAAKDLPPKARSQAVVKAGRLALIAREDDAARHLYDLYTGMLADQPRKTFDVAYYDTPIHNMTDFLALKNKPVPQLMDRAFGGDLDFLVTDVATGDRGAGIGSEKGKSKPFTQFSAFCDVNALHLVFFVPDAKVADIQAKVKGGGGFEMYLAPGVNQPYTCLLPNLPDSKPNIWHSTYNNFYQHRMVENSSDIRTEMYFVPDGMYYHMAFAWAPFYDKLPDAKNDVWEYENIGWSSVGGYSWNGTKSIHGRSTWGLLRFNLTPAQLLAVKRRIVYDSVALYKLEKITRGANNGILSFWQDPVLGDLDFYRAKLVPVVERLDSFLPLVKTEMSDADVETVFREAVPGWRSLRHIVADLRRQYLEEKLAE